MMLRYGVMCGEIFSSAKFVTYDSKKHGLRTFSFWRGKRKKVEPKRKLSHSGNSKFTNRNKPDCGSSSTNE